MQLVVHANHQDDHLARVFLALPAFAACKLSPGQSVLLSRTSPLTDPVHVVALVWPSLTVERNAVQTTPLILETIGALVGDYITLVVPETSVLEAVHVCLTAFDKNLVIDSLLTFYIRELLMDIRFITLNRLLEFNYGGHVRRFIVNSITSLSNASSITTQVYATNKRMQISVTHMMLDKSLGSLVGVSTAIGGLDSQLTTIHSIIDTALNRSHLYLRYGLSPPRGILLYGPPGTGKTLIARTIARQVNAHILLINGPEVISKFYGETEAKLRHIFTQARQHAPSIVFIDEIDAICPKRDNTLSEVDKRVVATLLTLLDGISSKDGYDRVLVLAATNRPNSLDDALRRPGRFDREIEIGIPSAIQRQSILLALLKNTPHTLTDYDLQSLSANMHGYVGADIASIVREAGVACVHRLVKQKPLTSTSIPINNKSDILVNKLQQNFESTLTITENTQNNNEMKNVIHLTMDDVRIGMQLVRPSAIREITIEVPKVRWEDIGGQAEIKQKLQESIEWPLKHADAFTRFGIRPPKGILLYGPPGCSKTLMAKALATEAGLNFLAVKGPELFSKWVGDSEKAVRELFRKARAASPSIIFFDEIDSIAVKRGSGEGNNSVADRVLSQLLNELDGIEALINVTVVGATNRPDVIDPALMRPGRIDRVLYVAPPDFASRTDILRIQTQRMACAPDLNIQEIALKLEGCSGAEVVNVCQQAALYAIEEDINVIHVMHHHFIHATETVTRRITPQMIQFYDDFRQSVGIKNV